MDFIDLKTQQRRIRAELDRADGRSGPDPKTFGAPK